MNEHVTAYDITHDAASPGPRHGARIRFCHYPVGGKRVLHKKSLGLEKTK